MKLYSNGYAFTDSYYYNYYKHSILIDKKRQYGKQFDNISLNINYLSIPEIVKNKKKRNKIKIPFNKLCILHQFCDIIFFIKTNNVINTCK